MCFELIIAYTNNCTKCFLKQTKATLLLFALWMSMSTLAQRRETALKSWGCTTLFCLFQPFLSRHLRIQNLVYALKLPQNLDNQSEL